MHASIDCNSFLSKYMSSDVLLLSKMSTDLLSNSIQQFHSLYILLKTITPFLSPDDSTKLKEAPSKDIPTTFSTLYYMVWTPTILF